MGTIMMISDKNLDERLRELDFRQMERLHQMMHQSLDDWRLLRGECEELRAQVLRAGDRVPPDHLQRESAHVNELNGVLAFLIGVLARLQRCRTNEQAQAIVARAQERIKDVNRGKPIGPKDEPADWDPGC